MKFQKLHYFILLTLIVSVSSFRIPDTRDYDGAWEIKNFQIGDFNDDNSTGILIISEGYYSWGLFKKGTNEFIAAAGGTQKIGGSTVEFTVMFHTMNSELIGKSIMYEKKGGSNKFTLRSSQNISLELKKIKEKEESPLKGTWQISEREQNGIMVEMVSGDRKTLKILSNGHFQWSAFNTVTGEFFGAGGGTYSLENGEYSEHIEFFSRDNSRVGADLSFNYAVEEENSKWYHSGLSSKGNEINEIWTRQ